MPTQVIVMWTGIVSALIMAIGGLVAGLGSFFKVREMVNTHKERLDRLNGHTDKSDEKDSEISKELSRLTAEHTAWVRFCQERREKLETIEKKQEQLFDRTAELDKKQSRLYYIIEALHTDLREKLLSDFKEVRKELTKELTKSIHAISNRRGSSRGEGEEEGDGKD